MNVQFAIQAVGQDSDPTVQDRNPDPRKSTIYVLRSPTRGQPHGAVRGQGDQCALARFASLIMVGKTLDELGCSTKWCRVIFR